MKINIFVRENQCYGGFLQGISKKLNKADVPYHIYLLYNKKPLNINLENVTYVKVSDLNSFENIKHFARESDVAIFLSDPYGDDMTARLGAFCNFEAVIAVKDFEYVNGEFVIYKGVFNSNLTAKYSLKGKIAISVLNTYEYVCLIEKEVKDCINLDFQRADFSDILFREDEVVEDISQKPLVFALGRGFGQSTDVERYEKLADKYGYYLGCTRPVALEGNMPINRMIGVSGKLLNAKVVVTFGVSGATPFQLGIENCQKVIAINKNEDALIFRNCDIGLKADCKKVLEYLESDV